MFSLSSMMPQRTLPELATSVRNMLNSMQAQISTAWDAQHKPDGTHGAVTATRVRADAFGCSRLYTYTVAALSADVVEIPAGVSFVEFVVPSGLGARFVVRGIRQSGVRAGDFLFLRSSPVSSFTTTLRSLGYSVDGLAPINTELVFPAQQASAADARLFEMVPFTIANPTLTGCWVPFVYSTARSTGIEDLVHAWTMLMTVSGV